MLCKTHPTFPEEFEPEHTRIVNMLSSDAGLLGADDSVAFRQQAASVAAMLPVVADHFNCDIKPTIPQFVFELRLTNQWVWQRCSNNGCESINHITYSSCPSPGDHDDCRNLSTAYSKWWTCSWPTFDVPFTANAAIHLPLHSAHI